MKTHVCPAIEGNYPWLHHSGKQPLGAQLVVAEPTAVNVGPHDPFAPFVDPSADCDDYPFGQKPKGRPQKTSQHRS